jgi:hypothetical protein
MAELTLSWSPNGEEYLGVLDATVTSSEFSGHSFAWFDRRWLKDNFVAPLETYPLSAAQPPKIERHLWDRDHGVLRIAVTPYNSRGTLLVRVDLATDVQSGPDEDLQHAITVRFLTEYEAVRKFAAEFDAVLDGRRENAILRNQEP